jgi:HK97 family phage portal protein
MAWFKRAKEVILKAVPVGIAPDWLTNTAQWSDFDAETASREGYKASPAVYSVIKKRADAVASVPLVVEQRRGDAWEPVADNHPLQALLDNPNPDLDRSEVMRLLVTHLDLAGNAYWLKTRIGNGRVAELWPMLPAFVSVKPGRDRLIQGYEYRQHGLKTNYPAQDVMHAAYTNPDSLYLGQSPLQAAGKAVDVDNSAAAWQKISMQNRGVPDGMFTFDGDMTPDDYAQAQKVISEMAEGSGNARRNLVMSKARYQQLSQTPVELDFMATREFSLRQFCAVYGVPIEMISGMGDANRASGENVRKTFWLDTIIPLLDEIVSALNKGLVRDFGDPRTLRIRFDLSAVPALQENYTEKLDNAQKLRNLGYPVNVINQHLELGFDDVEGGDIGYIPSGLIPASFDLSEPTESPEDAAREAFGNGANTDGE